MTIEIPEPFVQKAQSPAGEGGQTMGELVVDALQARFVTNAEGRHPDARKWLAGFAKLRHLGSETARIQRVTDEVFELVEAEDRF